MKLMRYGAPGAEKPGLIDASGVIRDLSAHVADITGETLAPASLDRLRALDPAALPAVPAGTRLGAPVARVWNFIAIGLNFVDHAKETGAQIPPEPILFNKAGNCIIGAHDDVMVPRDSRQLDYECEIAFVVGTRARYVSEADALAHIAGYTICNDVSERHWQKDRKGQWVKGKAFETSGPLGPWLVTPDEIADHRRWRGPPERDDGGYDLQDPVPVVLCFAVHGAGTRRRGDNGHTGGRRARHEGAEMAPGWANHDAVDRPTWRATAEDRSVRDVRIGPT